jgi:hypothetical protein
MRSKEEIKKDGTRTDYLIIEILLDIRELLNRPEVQVKMTTPVKRRSKTTV